MKWMVNKMEFIECPVCKKDINYHADYELKICLSSLIEEINGIREKNLKYLFKIKEENEELKKENNHLVSKIIKIEQIINNLD
jgi:uncharacterized protein YbaR (Trm112 family)